MAPNLSRLSEKVRLDITPATRLQYSRTTLPFKTECLAVAYPKSAEEIQGLVAFAREHKVPLYPVSRGKNWGYGETMAPFDQCLIVDLGEMNRIVKVDEELAYVVIEPGVSQGQLYEYLRDHHPSLWMDANGAGPDASLVGNLLERGFGHTPLGERASLCAGFEVVLGTGERIETGFGRFAGAHAQYTYKHGIGPSLDGLFFQSNLGIVTKAGLWLQKKPEAFAAFFCQLKDASRMPALVDRIRELRQSGVVRSCVHIGNPLRALTAVAKYPWDETGGRKPVSDEWIETTSKAFGIASWNATGGLYGPRAVVEAQLAHVRERLAEFGVLTLRDTEIDGLPPALKAAAGPAVGLLRGEPTNTYLRGAAWRSRNDTGGADPIQNGAGLLWIVPTLPATGTHAAHVEALLKAGLHAFGFDAPITLTFVNERTVLATSNISYDRTNADDTKAAWECYRALVGQLIQAGYPPYRCGLGGYDMVTNGEEKVIADLRRACDPDKILSPGRYEAKP